MLAHNSIQILCFLFHYLSGAEYPYILILCRKSLQGQGILVQWTGGHLVIFLLVEYSDIKSYFYWICILKGENTNNFFLIW